MKSNKEIEKNDTADIIGRLSRGTKISKKETLSRKGPYNLRLV